MRIDHTRHRDNQQWAYDWVVKTTGRPMNFEYDGRYFPPTVKSHAMVPKHLSRMALHRERIAVAAAEAGHSETALDLYWQAVEAYFQAQHAIFRDSPLKTEIYEAMTRCYDRIIALSPYRIERVEVEWEGRPISCLFHDTGPSGHPAPCVLSIPGMDRAKEHWYHPLRNVARERGLHLMTMDGPGQGSSNLRGIHVTDDNYERAAAAVLSYLESRPEVDADRLGVFGSSMGTHWAVRTAALDDRVSALATAAPVFGDKIPIFEQAAPRFKQVFMYMAGMVDEDAFDEMARAMTTEGYGRRIACPTLLVTGEFDPLSPLEHAEQLFDELAGPKELWVLEDDFHGLVDVPNLGSLDVFPFVFDWLADVLRGPDREAGEVRRVIPPAAGRGPYEEPLVTDRLDLTDPSREERPL